MARVEALVLDLVPVVVSELIRKEKSEKGVSSRGGREGGPRKSLSPNGTYGEVWVSV
jgi:hypothetical protein